MVACPLPGVALTLVGALGVVIVVTFTLVAWRQPPANPILAVA
ncbi:MAG: hypothetical protein SF172_05205 [Burkholderiales bacterium]|nr:hypothetical protein [Burkholderiales bacterium]